MKGNEKKSETSPVPTSQLLVWLWGEWELEVGQVIIPQIGQGERNSRLGPKFKTQFLFCLWNFMHVKCALDLQY